MHQNSTKIKQNQWKKTKYRLRGKLDEQSIVKSRILKSSTLSVQGSMCDLSCGSVSFVNLDALVFGAETLGTAASSWWIVPLMSM